MKQKKTFPRTALLLAALALTAGSTASAQSVAPYYECVVDSVIMNDRGLISISMADYQGVAKSAEGEHSCKLSLSWFGLPSLGGVPFYLLQFDIRPAKGLEAVVQKPSNRALVAFADNGVGVYDIGNAHCTLYPEGIRMQYLITENTDCMDLLARKDITRLTLTDSLYNNIGELEFENFHSASTLAIMQESLEKAFASIQPVEDTEAPLVGRPTDNAEYRGGREALERFLRKNVVHPQKKGIVCDKGFVTVSFIVNEDGKLSDFKVPDSTGPAFTAEALRVIKLMPAWKPAEFYGKPVKSQVAMSIDFVTEEAEFPHGIRALEEFRDKNLVYPEGMRDMGAEGTVWVTFIVDEKGRLSDFKLEKSVDPVLDAEALRVARLMPSWKPAKCYGKPIKSRARVPFFFYR